MAINYNIKGTGLEITDELRSYVEKDLAHVERLVARDSTVHVDVELQYLEEGRSGKFRAEFTLSSGGDVYRSEQWGTSMHEAIDLAGGHLTKELTRTKEKKIHVLRHSAVKVKEFLRGWRKSV